MTRTALLVAAVTACVSTRTATQQPATPQKTLSAIERSAESAPTAASYGRAAIATYVLTGDPTRTMPWISKAFAQDPNEPQAHYARLLIAREALDDREEAEQALTIVQRAPSSPLAELAAYRLREVAGQSPAIDKLIIEGLAGLHSGSMGLEGHAAMRARETLVALFDARNDDDRLTEARQDLGMPTAFTVVGPLQALRMRDFEKPAPFDDPKAPVAETYESVLGPEKPRVFETPGGGLDLEPETWRADVYDAVTNVETKESGEFIIGLRGAGEAAVSVDGALVVQRSSLPSRPPDRSWGRVAMPAGLHRLHVKFSRVDAGWFSLTLSRADGAPARLTFHAPLPGETPPPVTAHALPASPWGVTEAFAAAFDPPRRLDTDVEQFLRIQQTTFDDGDTARSFMSSLLMSAGDSAAIRSLDADLVSSDPDLPRPNIVSRIAQDLDAMLQVVPGDARALLGRFQQERNDKRYEQAEARLKRLTTVVGEAQPHALMERARFALEQGDVADARILSEKALKVDPGRCDALGFRADLARRDGEIALGDELIPQLMKCPGGIAVNVQFLRSRQRLTDAIPLLQGMLARGPESTQARRTLADALLALGDVHGAEEALRPLLTLWPHENEATKRLAAYRDLQGDSQGSVGLLHRALAMEGNDLMVARALAVDARSEVLGWAARDGLEAIADYRKADFQSDAPAVQVLDFGAIELQPDGSSLERVHSIVQVLDKRGINQFGEVSIPGDAQTLLLRTVKADGRILDAEMIAGKESISLPNLEPGDFVEYEFLRATGARPAAVPGWQGGQFVFRGEEVPFYESTYRVRVPASIGFDVDFANLDTPPKIERDGDMLTMTYTHRRGEPFLREPQATQDLENLPWLEAGTGAGQEALVNQLADWLPLRGRVTPGVTSFMRGVAANGTPRQRIQTIIDRIRDQVRGESSSMDLGDSAATILTRGRGNRLLALKACLDAAGIPSHFVIARPYSEYPREFRFPHGNVYHAAVLRIEPTGAEPIWFDFSLRQAPLDRLPAVLSGQDAFVVPNNAGESVQRIKLPLVDPAGDRTETDMKFEVDAAGTLTGTITQAAYGFDAAGLRWRLEQVNATEVRKQQERGLGNTFRGVTLTDFAIQDSGDPATPVVARSVIRVPSFTDRGNGSTGLLANFGLLHLGPRFVRLAERKTPLLLAADDLSRTHVTVKLPSGAHVQPPAPMDMETPFGHYAATWKLDGGALKMDEEFLLHRGRLSPEQYLAFKSFAVSVDAAQTREIPVAMK
jgi:tetratricopeptide (TPR) repeat protein